MCWEHGRLFQHRQHCDNISEYPEIATMECMAEKGRKYGRVLPMTWEKKSAILISSTSGFGRIRLFFYSNN